MTDAGIWWGHLGLSRENPNHGKGFIALRPHPVTKLAMPPMLTATLADRWWVGFEGGYSQERTCDELLAIADQLSTPESEIELEVV